jgi:uncharacterized repeat protein (TIGR01451 family)
VLRQRIFHISQNKAGSSMKPSTLHNLKRLTLVIGLALSFGLLTVSSTLATGAGDLTGLPASSAQPLEPPARAVERAAEARGSDRVEAAAEAAPQASRLDSSTAISPAGTTQLTTDALSQDWGDFDRDGYLDLALGTTSGISIYHNLNGRLEFSASLTNTRGYGVRWADINNNGLLELVTVKNAPGANSIYRYTAGSFVSYTAFNSAVPLARVVVLSGTRDLIASSSVISAPCTVFHYHKNLGNNTFATAPTCVAASASAGLSAGDYDGDGDSDLVVGSFPNELKLLVNHNGVLTETQFLTRTNAFVVDTVSSWPYDFAWGDYDGDQRFDLAAAYPLQRQIRIYHNDGGSVAPLKLSGIFPAQRFMTPLSIDWGDFDGDGALDLAVADDPPRIVFNVARSITATLEAQLLAGQSSGDTQWSARAVALDNSELSLALSGDLDPSTVYGTAGGHLRTEIVPLTTAAANSLAWGDTSGDGRLDLLLGAYALPNNSFLYLNANGTLTTTAAAPFVSGNRQSVALGKLDRKSDKQLGLIIGGGNSQNRGYVNVYTRTNQLAQVLSLPAPVGALALGDFNNDGWLDLLVGTRNANGTGTLLLYRNNQTTFDAKPVLSVTLSGQVQSVAWGDINPPTDGGGNRFLDFAVATSQQVYLYRNEGNNTFSTSAFGQGFDNTAVAWGDFDQDGDLDLAAGVGGQGVWLYLNNGNGTSFNPGWTSPAQPQITSLAAGDWNNDGWIDLAVGNAGEPDRVYANLGETPGDLQLVPVWASQDSGSTTALAWGDVNNDGYLDLAVSRQSGANGVYYNTALTPWQLPTPPTSIFMARPGRTFDAYLYSSSEFLPGYLSPVTTTLAQTATIYYTVANPLSAPITNTLLELSLDGGSTWRTPFYTRTQVPGQTSPAGRSGVLTWNAREDQAFSDNALFRIRVVDQSPVGPFQRASSAAVSPPFRVRAMTCQWLTGLWIEVRPSDQVQPLDTVTFIAKVSDFSGGTISYTWTIVDGPQTTIVDEGYSQISYIYENTGNFPVKLQAQHSRCTEGPPLEAVTYVQVGSQPVSQTQLYLPLIQRSGATAQAGVLAAAGESHQPRAASVATALGGQTLCQPRTIFPGTRPTVDWLSGVPGHHGQPALNQDGSRFAFWSTANLTNTNRDGNIELYYAQVDRPRSCVTFTQITSSTGDILSGFALGPVLNAAGDRLAFFSDQNLTGSNGDENFEIFFAQIDAVGGITVSQVTDSPRGINALPTLNAAGNRVAFVSDQNYGGGNAERNQEIYLAATPPISGQAVYTQVTQTGVGTFNDEPALSSGGDRIVFVRGTATAGGQDILTGPSDQSGAPITVTTSSATAFNYRPTIGGSGTQYTIAYATTYSSQEIVSLVAISGTTLSTAPVYTTTPNSQPSLNTVDGSRLLVVSGTQQLNVLRTAEGGLIPVYTCAGADCMYSALSGDGLHVAFAAGETLYEAYYEKATLELTLLQPTAPVIAGARLTRTIVLTNSGPGAADGVVFSSTLRDGLAAIVPLTVTAKPGSVCAGADTVICQIPGVGINSSTAITLSSNQPISIDEAGPLVFLAEASAWQAVTTTINPSLAVNAESDLRLTKALTTTTVAGEWVTYTLVITNGGPSRARDVAVTDRLPDDLILQSYSSFGSATFALTNTDSLITGTLAQMAPNISGTIQIVAQIRSATRAGRVISNTGVVTSAVVDPVTTGNQSQADFTVTARSGLTITKWAPASVKTVVDSVAPAEVVTYTIIVTNNGPSLARDVVLTDVLPVSVTFGAQVSAVPPATPTVAGQTIAWSLADIAPNATSAVTFTGRVITTTAGPVTLTNRSIVAATTASLSVTATADTFVIPRVRLAITKTLLSPQPVVDGQDLNYEIVLRNLGPSAVSSVNITDVLEAADGAIKAVSFGIPCTQIGNTLAYTCVVTPELAAGASRVITLTAKTKGKLSNSPTFTNTVYATATIATEMVSAMVVGQTAPPRATLLVTKTLVPPGASVVAGRPLTYAVTVGNLGPSDARNVDLTDNLPSELLAPVAFDNPNSTRCDPPAGGVVTCDLSLIEAFATKSITISGWLSASLPAGLVITNTAEATTTIASTVATDMLTSTVVWRADLRLSKLAPVTALSGAPLVYTLIITNDGPSVATTPIITDQLPISLTYISQTGATPPISEPIRTGQLLTWTLAGNLAPSATQIITFTTLITDEVDSADYLTNTAYATAPEAASVATDTATTLFQLQGNLILTKTVLNPNPVAGGPITYGITVTNLGPSRMRPVRMTDVLPPEVTLSSWPSECDVPANSVITCTRTARLYAGNSWLITLTGRITSSASSPFINTAYATATIATALANDSVATTPLIQIGLQVTKTAAPTQVAAGELITYTILAGNHGPSDANTVVITDRLPAELTFVAATPGYQRTADVITFTLSTLRGGEQRPFTITGRIDAALPSNTVLTNTAYLSSPLMSTITSSQVTRLVTTRADLRVTKLAPAAAAAGTPLTYTIIVINDGPSLAASLRVTDRLPISVTYLSALGADPAVTQLISTGNWLTWTLSDLTPQATQLITFSVRVTNVVDSAVLITNTAYASATASASVAQGAATTQLQPRAELALTKTLLTANPVAGNTVTYGITLTNLGPSLAASLSITDRLPSVLTFVAASASCPITTPVITCNVDNLTSGASHFVTVTARIGADVTTTFTNTAYATSTIAAVLTSSSISTTPNIQVGLQVTKSAALTVLAGTPLTYTLYVTNTGPSQAPLITLTDQLPLSVTLHTLPSDCTPAGNLITCALTAVGVGAANSRSVVLTPTVDTRVITGTPLANTVTVTSVHALNSVTAAITTTAWSSSTLRATKQAEAAVLAGNPLTYTIIVTNDGPSLAQGLVVTDGLPPELIFAAATPGCTPGGGGVVTCAAFALDKDAQQWITVTGQVSPAMPARVIANTAYVSSTVNATWFSRTVTTTVSTAADLQIGTTITPTSVVSNAASVVRVTIIFTNAGPSDARTVYITETLNALTYTTGIAQPVYVTGPTGANCSGGSAPHQCSWFIATLTRTLTGTIEFTATTPITTTTAQITAQIASAGTSDPAGGNTATTSLLFVRALLRNYWVGLWPVSLPLLMGLPPRNFWSSSP